MSIIETKFRKNYVETPELRTNTLVCNKFNYTGELSEESLGLPIFDITDEDEGTWYPVLKKLAINDNPAGNGAFRNVQLPTGTNSAFYVLNNAKIKTITQVQRDDSRGDVSIGTECFMVLYGKKADNTYSFIAKSVNKNVQTHGGGTLTWNFSDVEWNYKNQYTKLIITLAQVPYAYDQDGSFTLDENMNRIELDFFEAYGENGPTFPTVAYIPNVDADGNKTYENMKMSGKGSNGGQCVVMSTNNTNTQNFTPQITISYTDLELQPATVPHKDNSQVHVTPSEKTKLMATATQLYNHANNAQIHVTAQQKAKWDKVGDIVQLTAGEFIEINDNAISVKTSSSISDDTNTVPTSAALFAHANNNDLHVSEEILSKVDQAQSSVESIKQKINDIYTILNIREESFTNMQDGLSSPAKQKMNAGMVVLSKAHFTSGIVKSISFPYAGGKGATVYLAVQIINEDENISASKTYQQTIYSSKSVTQEVNSNGTSTFEFSKLIIPENYKAVRFGFVENNTTVPQYNAENCLSGQASNAFRIKLLQNDSNSNTWDSDECQVYTAPSRGVGNYVTLIEATLLNSDLNQLFHKVQQIESELNQS